MEPPVVAVEVQRILSERVEQGPDPSSLAQFHGREQPDVDGEGYNIRWRHPSRAGLVVSGT